MGEEWRPAGAPREQAGTKCSATAGATPTVASGHRKMKHTQQVRVERVVGSHSPESPW